MPDFFWSFFKKGNWVVHEFSTMTKKCLKMVKIALMFINNIL